jgi:type II secretory pathway component PulK
MTRPGEHGFALLIVAIAVLTLSLIFAAALDAARQRLAATTTELERVKLLAAADGAIATAEHDLAAARTISPPELAAPLSIAIGDTKVELSVRPEGSKLDLNAAAPKALLRYFILAGLDANAARELVDEIMARRKKAAVSVTASRYENGAAYLFQTVSELGNLKGAQLDLLDCVGPDLTVFTGTSLIDAAHASQRVRTAMGLSPDATPPASMGAAVTGGRSIVAGEVFEVTARAKDAASGQVVARQAIIRITGNPKKPVWVLAQTAFAPDGQYTDAACDRLQPAGKVASMARRD